MNDSAYTSFSYDFNLDEDPLPSQDEFNQQIRQDCLTSMYENECLVSRLNKINKVVLNDFVSRDASLNDSCNDSINDSHNEP